MPGPNPGAADRAAHELTADPARSDELIAQTARCSSSTVSRIRAELAASELIPAVPYARRASFGRNPGAYDRASAELVTNPYRSNGLIAQLADCTPTTAGQARYDLERTGLIHHVPAIERIPKLLATAPRPQATAAARALIDDPHRSDQLIAEAAGCSRATAWHARAQLESMGLIPVVRPPQRATRLPRAPRYADAAASTDALTVSVSARCPRCRQPFTFVPHPHRPLRRYCGSCGPARRLPRVIELPPQPEFSRATCAVSPPPMRAWWTSGDRTQREAAAALCATCPVLSECARWSLSLPPDDDTIYAGMGADERRSARLASRAVRAPAPRLNPQLSALRTRELQSRAAARSKADTGLASPLACLGPRRARAVNVIYLTISHRAPPGRPSTPGLGLAA